jgi:hypothetical protein
MAAIAAQAKPATVIGTPSAGRSTSPPIDEPMVVNSAAASAIVETGWIELSEGSSLRLVDNP